MDEMGAVYIMLVPCLISEWRMVLFQDRETGMKHVVIVLNNMAHKNYAVQSALSIFFRTTVPPVYHYDEVEDPSIQELLGEVAQRMLLKDAMEKKQAAAKWN